MSVFLMMSICTFSGIYSLEISMFAVLYNVPILYMFYCNKNYLKIITLDLEKP